MQPILTVWRSGKAEIAVYESGAGGGHAGERCHANRQIYRCRRDDERDGDHPYRIIVASAIVDEVTQPNAENTADLVRKKTLNHRIAKVTPQNTSPTLLFVNGFVDNHNHNHKHGGVWYALLAPRGTPPNVVRSLYAECTALLKCELDAQMAADGIAPIGQPRKRCINTKIGTPGRRKY